MKNSSCFPFDCKVIKIRSKETRYNDIARGCAGSLDIRTFVRLLEMIDEVIKWKLFTLINGMVNFL